MSAVFYSKISPKLIQVFKFGQQIPPGLQFTPSIDFPGKEFIYTNVKGQTFYLGGKDSVPDYSVFVGISDIPKPATNSIPSAPSNDVVQSGTVISPGGNYVTSDGSTISVAPNTMIPDNWVPVVSTVFSRETNKHTGVVEATDYIQTTDVPEGYETYNLPNGNYIVVRKGLQHPASWELVQTTSNNQTDLGPTVDPFGNLPMDLVPMPSDTTTWPSLDSATLGKIIAIVGIAGISYIGYLFLFKPAQIKYFIQQFDELTSLVVDSAMLVAAIGFLVAVSFVSYEFFVSYEKTGTVGGALGDMAAKSLVEFINIFIDAVEQIGKDLLDYASGALTSLPGKAWGWVKDETSGAWNFIKKEL